MTSKDVPHARRRDHHAKLLQLTADAEIAPARVLSRETKDECDGIGIERVGRDLLRSRERPVPPNELAVPAQQGCRGDEKGGPTLAPGGGGRGGGGRAGGGGGGRAGGRGREEGRAPAGGGGRGGGGARRGGGGGGEKGRPPPPPPSSPARAL